MTQLQLRKPSRLPARTPARFQALPPVAAGVRVLEAVAFPIATVRHNFRDHLAGAVRLVSVVLAILTVLFVLAFWVGVR